SPADRGGAAVLRQHRPPAGVLVDHRQGGGAAVAPHGGGRPGVDHAGGERDLLGGGAAPGAPHRADLADPVGGPDPGPAGHPLPAAEGAPHPGGRPDRRPGDLPLLVDRGAARSAAVPADRRRPLSRGDPEHAPAAPDPLDRVRPWIMPATPCGRGRSGRLPTSTTGIAPPIRRRRCGGSPVTSRPGWWTWGPVPASWAGRWWRSGMR